MCSDGRASVVGDRYLAMRSMAPELESARLRMSTSATVMVAGWLNPPNASGTGMRPNATVAINAANATMS